MLLPRRVSRARLSVLALAAVGALVGALAGPAGAAAPAPSRVLLTDRGSGLAWTAAVVSTDGAAVTSTLSLTEVALPLQAGFRVYDAERKLVHAGTVSYLDGDEGVQVQAAPVPGVTLNYSNLERDSSKVPVVDVALGLNTDQANVLRGTYTLLVWVSGSTADGRTWTVRGAPGVTLGATSTGAQVRLLTSRDFNGTASVVAAGRGAAARAQVLSSAGFSVRGTLVGSFAPVLSSVDSLRVRRGSGVEQACVPSCTFTGAAGEAGAGPGVHVFSLTGAGAGGVVQNTGEVLLGVADVRLP